MEQVKFFCINLDTRKDRWENCKKQFTEQGINPQRWSATPLPENRRFGAGLSHREIIDLAKKNNWNYVGVFEDDIRFLVDDFQKQANLAINNLKNADWYILYFGGLIGPGGSILKEKSVDKLLRVRKLFEAHAVIYHKKFFDIYLAEHPRRYSSDIDEYYLDKKYRAFDEWFANVIQINYPCYITKNILVTQKDDFSSIENKVVSRYKSSVYHFYLYKYLGSKIATYLDICGTKIKKNLKKIVSSLPL